MSDHKWFDFLKDIPALGAALIAYNNISVCINAMIGGVMLGLGGIIILVFNGFYFGAVLGYAGQYGFDESLLNFVVTHGPLELSLIVASCFCGMMIGKAFCTVGS